MTWRVEFLDGEVMATLGAFPRDIRASFERIVSLIERHGLERVREPYVRHLEGPVWEMRMKGRDGIARAAYVTATGRRVVVVHSLRQKDTENAPPGNRYSPETGEGGPMKRQYIPVGEAFKEWRRDPEYVAEYDALEAEFALASALIKARGDAHLTQEQVAAAMGTTQAFVARLESGRVLPSTRTLERFAKATHTRLRISFEPEKPDQGVSS